MGLIDQLARGNFSKVNIVAAATAVVSITLDFTIEGALFNDFLHHEAVQLSLRTLKRAAPILTCAQYKFIYARAIEVALATGYRAHMEYGWLNPWTRETYDNLFQTWDREFSELYPTCEGSSGGYSQRIDIEGELPWEVVIPNTDNPTNESIRDYL